MKLLGFFYDAWAYISLISVAVGLLVNIIPIKKSNEKETSQETGRIIRYIKIIFNILIIILVSISCVTFALFTRVPNVRDASVSDAILCLRDHDLNDRFLLGLEYDSAYANSLVNFQSIEGGELALRKTTVYVGYPKDIIVFESTADNANNNTSTPNTDKGHINQSNKMVNIPNVVGMEQKDAVSALYMAGLQFQVYWDAAAEPDNDKYYVVSQSGKYGDSVNLGTIVKLELSPILPESIDYKVFTYERDDLSVKDTSELNGFYIYSKSVTSASFYNSLTDEILYPDYLPEKLCEINLNITGADNAVLSIFMDGKSTGVCIDNKSGTADFFINKGKYIVNADFGDHTKTELLYVDSSGNYTVNFK